jgi:hypothetical protein
MSTSLEAAVDELYSAFGRRKRPTVIDHCSHCIRADHVKQLLAPVREIPVEALLSYTMSAADTVGSASDFRYFLPRIVDLALAGAFGGYPDLEFVLRRFGLAYWPNWPQRERQAVMGFTHALWNSTLARFPTDPDAEETLGAISQIKHDITPYLRTWEAALTQRAGASHLQTFVHDHFGRAGAEYWLTARNLSDSAFGTVRTWLGSPQLTETVAAAVDAATDDETGDVLLETLAAL